MTNQRDFDVDLREGAEDLAKQFGIGDAAAEADHWVAAGVIVVVWLTLAGLVTVSIMRLIQS